MNKRWCEECRDLTPELATGGCALHAPVVSDAINRPAHYCVNGLECIDVIEGLGLGFRLANVLKYLWRAGRKDAELNDLKKARWYLDREIAKREP